MRERWAKARLDENQNSFQLYFHLDLEEMVMTGGGEGGEMIAGTTTLMWMIVNGGVNVWCGMEEWR